MDLWETLNSAYEPLYRRVHSLCGQLTSAGYKFQWNWYAFHFSRRPEGFQPEFFPIPVVTVENVCDIGLELDHIFIERMLPRAQALDLDWSSIRRPFEVYGADDYCGDLYLPGMTPDQLRERIVQSGAEDVGVQLTLAPDCPDGEILAAVAECREWSA